MGGKPYQEPSDGIKRCQPGKMMIQTIKFYHKERQRWAILFLQLVVPPKKPRPSPFHLLQSIFVMLPELGDVVAFVNLLLWALSPGTRQRRSLLPSPWALIARPAHARRGPDAAP